MFVRTDPRDNTRRVVTEEGALEVQDERAKRDGTWEFVKAKRDRESATREKLAQGWNMNSERVSAHDVEWAILNEDALEAMKHANWLDYMFTCWDMANALLDRGSLDQATAFMIRACYLRMNGPNNMHPNGLDMSSVYKPFQPNPDPVQVVGELSNIQGAFEKLGVSVDEGLEQFGDVAERESKLVPMPWPEARELMRSWLTSPPQ